MAKKSEFYALSLDEQLENYFEHTHLSENSEKLLKFKALLEKVHEEFPELTLEFRWYQPMFTLNVASGSSTFIASFTAAKNWINFAAENWTQINDNIEITEKNYQHTVKFVQFPFKNEVDFDFISRMIENQIREKQGYRNFWKSKKP